MTTQSSSEVMPELRRCDGETEWEVDRRYYANEAMHILGPWIATTWWIVHNSVDGLPDRWLAKARVPAKETHDEWMALVDRYVVAVEDTAARERPRFARAHQASLWTFESVYGKAPIGINADVRRLVEALTPGAVWWHCPATVLHDNKDKAGTVFARMDGDRILSIVAGRDPRNAFL